VAVIISPKSGVPLNSALATNNPTSHLSISNEFHEVEMTNFDIIYDRSESAAEKWNKAALRKHFGSDEILPFWVADMEFQAPPSVIESLVERAQNGILG